MFCWRVTREDVEGGTNKIGGLARRKMEKDKIS